MGMAYTLNKKIWHPLEAHVIAEKAKVYQARMNKLKSAVSYVDVIWLTTL